MERIIYFVVFVFSFAFQILWSFLFLKIKQKSVLTESLLILVYLFSGFWLFVSGGVIDLDLIIYFIPAFYIVTILIDKMYNKSLLLKKCYFYVYSIFVS